MNTLNNFLGKLNTDQFLKKYWNKKPLLIKNALPQSKQFATKEDLLEFAMDEDFESRIIYENNGVYSVKDGPLNEEDLKGQFTVACHALNLFSDDFQSLENLVTSFIPHWQFDDVMATVSTKGASVGAHTDHYGVFILQAQGSREWFIQENPNQDFKEGLDIKILKDFNPDYSWILEPGDMIYVPPLCGHHGVTKEESISYSIGFKAFETKNIAKDYLFDLADNINDDSFYKHEVQSGKYELNDEFVDFFHKKLKEQLNNKSLFKSWLASNLSRQRYPDLPNENQEDFTLNDLEVAYDTKMITFKNEVNGKNHVYINSEYIELGDEELHKLKDTLDSKEISSDLSDKIIRLCLKANAIIRN